MRTLSADWQPKLQSRGPKPTCCALQRAAMTQSALSKERRELREQQQRTALEAIPKDLSRPWEDPLPEPGERHLAQVNNKLPRLTLSIACMPLLQRHQQRRLLSSRSMCP